MTDNGIFERLRAGARWGIAWGVYAAVLLSMPFLALVQVARLAGGSLTAQLGAGFWEVIGAYWFGAIVGGTVLGVCRTWARRSSVGAGITGAIVAWPVYGAAFVALEGVGGL